MPPEQALGRAPDARSRSLLARLRCSTRWSTGRPPFLGDDPVAIISQHINTAPVAPSWHNPASRRPLGGADPAAAGQGSRRAPAERRSGAPGRVATAPAPAVTPRRRCTPASDANPLDRLAGGVFVGRDAELERAARGLDDALSGQPRLLLLVGEPGIGKTRVGRGARAPTPRLRGAQVLWGRCYEWEGAPAYWPWVQIIRGLRPGPRCRRRCAPSSVRRRDIAQVVSEIRERLPGCRTCRPHSNRSRRASGSSTASPPSSRTPRARQPLVLVLDDLHWADKPSLLLLEFLAARAARRAAAAARDLPRRRGGPAAPALADAGRTGARAHRQRVLLRGLGEPGRWRASSRLTPASRHPTRSWLPCSSRDGGQPVLRLSEVVRMLEAEGRLQTAGRCGLVDDDGSRRACGRSLAAGSTISAPACNSVLTTAAVIGREFGLDALERVTQIDGDHAAGTGRRSGGGARDP